MNHWAGIVAWIKGAYQATVGVVWKRELLVTTLMAAVLSSGFNYLLDLGKEDRDDRRQVVKQFSEKSREFDVFASAYVYALVEDGAVNKDARRKLLDNLISQRSMLPDIKKLTGTEGLADEYDSALMHMNDLIPETDGVTKMRRFWEGASNILEKRDALLGKLGVKGALF